MVEQKQRHGCLTAWLTLICVANSAGFLMDLLGNASMMPQYQVPLWLKVLGMIGSIFNIICAVALFKWKKWGFWGLIASCIVGMFSILFMGIHIGTVASVVAAILTALLPFCGVVILYVVLHIGKENKGWPQLK